MSDDATNNIDEEINNDDDNINIDVTWAPYSPVYIPVFSSPEISDDGLLLALIYIEICQL